MATRVVDGDGHLFEDEDAIEARLPEPYRDIIGRGGSLFPPIDHLHFARAVDTPPKRERRPKVARAGWQHFLNATGIEWTVLYPSFALSWGKIVSLDFAVVVCRAYNDWLHETYIRSDPRFKGMAIIPMQDPLEAAKELRRVVTELGFVGAVLPTNGLPQPLGAKAYWPVYEEANRLGSPLAVHGGAHDRFGMDQMNMYIPVHGLGHPWGLMFNAASMLYGGIYDRFPKLRVAYLEGGIAWLLVLLERLHASHETHFQYIPPGDFGIPEGEDPAAYMKALIAADRFYLGIETEELTLPFALDVVGNRGFFYSSDFPHEVTLESCKHDIGELLESAEITQDDKAALLYGNAERFYRLQP
jgi:predicted TIM-barrel fold metal-dependent hydrolase